MALDDTIAELIRRRDAENSSVSVKRSLGAEWAADVKAVMDAIRAAVARYVEAGTAEVRSELFDITEDLIGPYPAQRLYVTLAGVTIIAEPIARFTFGGTGRIDLFRENRTSEGDRLIIFRPKDLPDGERAPWLIETRGRTTITPFVRLGGVETGSRHYRTFDQAGIEAALDHLLTLA